MMRLCAAITFVLVLLSASPARAASTCDPDRFQESGSIYRICMPDPADYNGMLVIWAHGFQDAGTPVGIPEDQLCLGSFCIPEIANSLGFGFATNSYSKTGMAILQGKDDILDLVGLYAAQKGTPQKVYLVGASEGGIITALSLEQYPGVYSAGLAACGPIGSFPLQINYLGDARATFEYFFPGLIPGDPFDPDPGLVAIWSDYYELVVKPFVLAPANRDRLNQWVAVAHLPYDADNYLETVEVSVQDVLRFSIVNIQDAAVTLGGFPFDNSTRVYKRIGARSPAEPVGAARHGSPRRRHGHEHVVPDQWSPSTTVDHDPHAARPAGALHSRAALRAEDTCVRGADHPSSADRDRSIRALQLHGGGSARQFPDHAVLRQRHRERLGRRVVPSPRTARGVRGPRTRGWTPYRLGGAALAVRRRQPQ